MGIPRSLRKPLIGIESGSTLRHASRLLDECRLNAISVESERGALLGMLDAPALLSALRKVGFDATAPVQDVPLAPLATISRQATIDQAIDEMRAAGAEHGVIEIDGQRWLVCHDRLMSYRFDQLRHENEALEAFVCVDGIGGD